ncbi:MAG TPA: D-xylose ABC transporter substrate-binding protein [Burkholderiaceae bacterium]|nr:D-xylose ABC transporter substrate-binding protein [Burkholderiaceae bacterium]
MFKQRALFALAAFGFAAAVSAQTVGVSWSNFQEERWKTDEAAIKGALDKAGLKYISADAGGSAEKQAADVESLITKGANVLIILAWDQDAILPSVQKAVARKIPVIAYDRLIQDKDVYYLTFNNKEVGRMQAREVFKVKPEGNYVFIKGAATDPNADFLRSGQQEVLDAAMKAGKIKNVGEQYTDGWAPENAQKNMEQILTKTGGKVDAVVASNDGTAGGVVAALRAHNMVGIPVSGQDGDHAALNRVALGEQTVSVWKDSRELGKVAGELAASLLHKGPAVQTTIFKDGSKHIPQKAVLLAPIPITKANLQTVIDAKWISKAEVCAGVDPAKAPAACK